MLLSAFLVASVAIQLNQLAVSSPGASCLLTRDNVTLPEAADDFDNDRLMLCWAVLSFVTVNVIMYTVIHPIAFGLLPGGVARAKGLFCIPYSVVRGRRIGKETKKVITQVQISKETPQHRADLEPLHTKLLGY